MTHNLPKNDRGFLIYLDLDDFGQIMKDKAWIRYSPNRITGKLSALVEDLVIKYFVTILWGFNRKEGTEECMLLVPIPFEESGSIFEDLENIRTEIEGEGEKTKTGATIGIGIAVGPLMDFKPAASRKKKHLYGSPLRSLAKRALEDAKKQGGNKICIHYL